MEVKPKKCKGTGKAKGLGCGEMTLFRKYGLCSSCLGEFLFGTEQGKLILEKTKISAKKKVINDKKQELRQERRELNEKNAMSLADTYFSRYIRLKHSENGKCTCYTCGNILPIKQVDNGHYIKREHKATRYHENNCKPQCRTCNGNIKHNGKQVEFRINLINEIGLEKVEELEQLGKTSIKADYHFYKEIADIYREKIKEIQKELGIRIW